MPLGRRAAPAWPPGRAITICTVPTSTEAEETSMGPTSQLLAISAIVMGLAHTVANERLFLPLRRRLGGRETWLGYLVSCPYCASHWFAFAIVPLTGTYYVSLA